MRVSQKKIDLIYLTNIMLLFFLLILNKVWSIKSYNETETEWTEDNCVLYNSTDFSPINIKTRMIECDPDIFMDF